MLICTWVDFEGFGIFLSGWRRLLFLHLTLWSSVSESHKQQLALFSSLKGLPTLDLGNQQLAYLHHIDLPGIQSSPTAHKWANQADVEWKTELSSSSAYLMSDKCQRAPINIRQPQPHKHLASLSSPTIPTPKWCWPSELRLSHTSLFYMEINYILPMSFCKMAHFQNRAAKW